MRITHIEAIPVLIPFNTEWEIATGSDYGNGYVIVRIHTDEGLTGIGEIGRFYEGETVPGIVNLIHDFYQPLLQAAPDPLNIAAMHKAMNRIKDNRFTKSAMDIALYDLKGKALGVPVHNLLGGAYRRRVEMCQSVGIKDRAQVLEDVRTYVERDGFRSLKIKIGLDPQGDLELVQAIRSAVGPEVAIRPDANQAYSAAVAIPILREMEKCRLSLVEQPVPLWDLEGSRRVCDALDTPIMACESARTPFDVMQIARHEAADLINIKLGRPGGFTGAKKMEAVADAAGLPVTVGTMMEMGVGTAAALQFAVTCQNLVDTCDFTGPTLLNDDILTEPLRFEDGYLYLPEGPGLGVEIDEDKLNHYRIDR